MHLSHHRSLIAALPQPFHTKRSRQAHGYVLAMFGLMLVLAALEDILGVSGGTTAAGKAFGPVLV